MQPPTVREVIQMLEREGFVWLYTKGDHRRFVKGKFKVTVPGNLRDHLHPKTWKSIQIQAGWLDKK